MMRRFPAVILGAAVATLVSASLCAETRAPARPVIIIPGTTATELTLKGDLVWPPDQSPAPIKDFASVLSRVSLTVDRLELLACDELGNSRQPIRPVRMTPDQAPVTGRLGVGDFYAPLAEALRGALGGQAVSFFGYDWRQDNYSTADELHRFIRKIQKETGARKVDIVAHSMGGIVTAAYLTRYGDLRSVGRAVFLGTPFTGAAQALCVLAGSDVSLLAFMPGELRALGQQETTSVHQLMGGVDYTIAVVSRTFPSVYQLLPAHEQGELPFLAGSLAVTAQASSGAAYLRSTTQRLAQVLRNVQASAIVGTGFPTVGRADLGEIRATGATVETTMCDGDGTVPLESAIGGGVLVERSKRFPVKHEALVTDARCIDAIIAELSRQ